MEKVVKKIKKRLQGVVVSAKAKNTIKVRVETKYPHALYGKIIKKHKNYLVHCVDEKVQVGDKVFIEEGKRISKKKSFYFIKKIT